MYIVKLQYIIIFHPSLTWTVVANGVEDLVVFGILSAVQTGHHFHHFPQPVIARKGPPTKLPEEFRKGDKKKLYALG